MKRTLNIARAVVAAALTCGLVALAGAAVAQDYDIVIKNGRVMDPETMYDSVANVGVKGGRIAAISKEGLAGAKTIDATGKIVAPGFIDTHFHWQAPLGYAIGLRDGLTSSMDMEMGCAGSYIAAWYEKRAGTSQANYGCGVSLAHRAPSHRRA